ncbi:LamG domain-containing protein [Nocardioides sp. MAHUQ-72]|uniref:LamG domain-containing protein n=1 Tax=unclassified Nocardioides TaxID=2615069 RepID=UPI0036065A51
MTRGGASALAAALLLTGCESEGAGTVAPEKVEPPADAPTAGPRIDLRHRALMLRFHEARGHRGRIDEFVNSGVAPLKIEAVTFGPGTVEASRSPRGQAVRFPAYSAAGVKYAIIKVSNVGGYDTLRPNQADFTFGADFNLDRVSDGSSSDNGDNLVQRGLFESPSQYKIQVDHGVVTCAIRGMGGQVELKAHSPVQPGSWYRVRCTRRGDGVRLAVAPLGPDGVTDWEVVRRSGPIGPVIGPQDTPLSIGGKLGQDGSLFPASTDQFNGRVTRVFYRILH